MVISPADLPFFGENYFGVIMMVGLSVRRDTKSPLVFLFDNVFQDGD